MMGHMEQRSHPAPAWPAARRPPRRLGGRWGHGPFRRAREGKLAGGIAAGVAQRTGLDGTLVRVVFVVAALLSSFVVLALYVLAWLLLPRDDETGAIAARALTDGGGLTLALGFGSLLAALLLILSLLGAGWLGLPAWPLVVSGAGLVLIWRNAATDEQEIMRHAAAPLARQISVRGRSRLTVRLAVGAALLAG